MNSFDSISFCVDVNYELFFVETIQFSSRVQRYCQIQKNMETYMNANDLLFLYCLKYTNTVIHNFRMGRCALNFFSPPHNTHYRLRHTSFRDCVPKISVRTFQ